MTLILTILTGILFLAFLLVLGWALRTIGDTLEKIRCNLERIAMGVRAIEKETAPLPGGVVSLNGKLAGLESGFESVETSLRTLTA